MSNFTKRYRDLETEVLSSLRFHIPDSKHRSKHTDEPCIPVNSSEFKEIALINDRLTLINEDGYHYDIFCISLEHLVEIAESLR
jgi:hypothetical protein